MSTVLVLGASGMAGHVIYTYLCENTNFQVFGTTNKTLFTDDLISLDIFDVIKLEKILKEVKPNIIINCIGSLIGESRKNPDITIYCNAYFPYLLKKYTKEIGAKIIHISTDCVFSGNKGPYTEIDVKDADNIYGLSKSLGELDDNYNLTIRTSIIGPEIKGKGEGLFHWFMNENETINGYKSNYWSGVTTLELAKFIRYVIDYPITGLIHLTNGMPISKYDLLKKINFIYNKGIEIQSNKDFICDKTLVKSKRISYLVPNYDEMLIEQKDFMNKHRDFYVHYVF
jgi:dTDP-4-dehydrorhamnose reductase